MTFKLLFSLKKKGFICSIKPKSNRTKVFLFILSIGLSVSVISFLVELSYQSNWINNYCNDYKLDGKSCASYRRFRWMFSIFGLIICMPSLLVCLLIAYSSHVKIAKHEKCMIIKIENIII